MINLDRRPDRYEMFRKNVQAVNLNPDAFERVSAVDGRHLRQEYSHLSPRMRAVKGCLLSHLNIWKRIVADPTVQNKDLICVLEDDVHFSDKFEQLKDVVFTEIYNESATTPTKRQLFYIGGRFEPLFCPKTLNGWIKKGEYLFQRPTDLYKMTHRLEIDRTTHFLILNKEMCSALIFIYETFFIKTAEAVDAMLEASNRSFTDLYFYDCFPHLVWSPLEYDTDIQKEPC